MIQIDLLLLIEMLLPPVLRWIFNVKYIEAATAPLNTVLTAFYSFFNATEYELIFNGQVIMMEHLLNDQFDNALRRIYIDDADQIPAVYWFNQSENNEDNFLWNESEGEDPVYLFNTSQVSADVDFIVYVPVGLVYDENLMKYYINKYRAGGKRFKIEEI